jgi:hypothetical protein
LCLQTPSGSPHTNFYLLFTFEVLNILLFRVSIIFFMFLGWACKLCRIDPICIFVFFHFWGIKYTFLVAFRSFHKNVLIESLLVDKRQIFLLLLLLLLLSILFEFLAIFQLYLFIYSYVSRPKVHFSKLFILSSKVELKFELKVYESYNTLFNKWIQKVFYVFDKKKTTK